MSVEEYDYVVVGAGSAGCVVAARLAEDRKHTVLLLEAGGRDTNPWIHIPLGYGKLFNDRRNNWMYETSAEPGLGNRKLAPARAGGVALPVHAQGPGGDRHAGSGFFRSLPGLSGPDLQVTLITSSLARRDAKGVELHGFSGFTMSAVVLQPLSRGSVKVSSADPAAMPRIQFNHLTHPQDRDTVLRGLSLVRKLARARSLSRYVQREHAPGDLADDSPALEGYVRRTGGSGYHSVGTCAMGTGADSVVDARLRVHGIDRLRIADASVMPRVTAGNTHAPTAMIAERAADFCRQDADLGHT